MVRFERCQKGNAKFKRQVGEYLIWSITLEGSFVKTKWVDEFFFFLSDMNLDWNLKFVGLLILILIIIIMLLLG